MDVPREDQVDQDFLLYLSLAKSALNQIKNQSDYVLCQQWLKKLCAEPYTGIVAKRKRNVYLSNLVLAMSSGDLAEPFSSYPKQEDDLSDAYTVFGQTPTNIQEIKESIMTMAAEGEADLTATTRDGRTYLATKTLPNNRGAFAYLAVTLDDDSPPWSDNVDALNENLEEKYRKIHYIDNLLMKIADELDGVTLIQDLEVNQLVERFTEELSKTGELKVLEKIPENRKRRVLLTALHEKISMRRHKIQEQSELFENSASGGGGLGGLLQSADETVELSQVWEETIAAPPAESNLRRLDDNYPDNVKEKFAELLQQQRRQITERGKRKYDKMMAQMRGEYDAALTRLTNMLNRLRKERDSINMVLAKAVAARKQMEEALKPPADDKAATQLQKLIAEVKQKYTTNEQQYKMGQALADEIKKLNEKHADMIKQHEEQIRFHEKSNREHRRQLTYLRSTIVDQKQKLAEIAPKSADLSDGDKKEQDKLRKEDEVMDKQLFEVFKTLKKLKNKLFAAFVGGLDIEIATFEIAESHTILLELRERLEKQTNLPHYDKFKKRIVHFMKSVKILREQLLKIMARKDMNSSIHDKDINAANDLNEQILQRLALLEGSYEEQQQILDIVAAAHPVDVSGLVNNNKEMLKQMRMINRDVRSQIRMLKQLKNPIYEREITHEVSSIEECRTYISETLDWITDKVNEANVKLLDKMATNPYYQLQEMSKDQRYAYKVFKKTQQAVGVENAGLQMAASGCPESDMPKPTTKEEKERQDSLKSGIKAEQQLVVEELKETAEVARLSMSAGDKTPVYKMEEVEKGGGKMKVKRSIMFSEDQDVKFIPNTTVPMQGHGFPRQYIAKPVKKKYNANKEYQKTPYKEKRR